MLSTEYRIIVWYGHAYNWNLSADIQSARESVPATLWVRILHSAKEDNLSSFD